MVNPPPKDRPMHGVIIHISDPKISNTRVTTLKNIPDTHGFPPSFPKILKNRAQLLLTFLIFPITTGQSSSKVIRMQPRHLNDFTKFTG